METEALSMHPPNLGNEVNAGKRLRLVQLLETETDVSL
jgi:hypothetical protein